MSRADAEFALRLPELLRARIERAASASRRSLNAEVVVRLEHSFCREGVADGDAPLPAQTAPRGLRLLCLLVPRRPGRPRSLPVHGMRPLPPRADVQGRWEMGLPAGLVLRETQARAPRPEVLERCLRQRAAHPFRAHSRTLRRLSHV